MDRLSSSDIHPHRDPSVSPSRRGSPDYRPDIDGLRCIAVLSVVLFHLGFKALPGGWVGVDVFFVISGFLITRLIRDEVAKGSFSFAGFYSRRVRRLFPAFFCAITASFLVGSFLFDRVYRQHFAGETVYALAAASNIFYWLDGGYFGVAEEYKPLLHTWSLGVVEQFYLIWPLAITSMLRYRPQWVRPVLMTAFLGSLLLAECLLYANKPYAGFFLLPSRIFEFAIGALLAFGPEPAHRNEHVREVALLLGIALIAYSVCFFTTGTPFPGVYAMIPCGGAGLAIFGGTGKGLRFLLGNLPMAGVGRISYSLYLIHWPIIVFLRYHRLEPLTWLNQLAILAAALALATLMYRFIEQPFRTRHRSDSSSRTAYGLTCALLTIVLLVPAAVLWAKGTLLWKSRVYAMDAAALKQAEDQQHRDEIDSMLDNRVFDDPGSRLRLMFVGDSHSADVGAAIYMALGSRLYDYALLPLHAHCFSAIDKRPRIAQIVAPRADCRTEISQLEKSRSLAEADYLFISNYWEEDTIKGFEEGLALLRRLSKAKILLVGQNAIFPTFDASLRFIGSAQLASINRIMFEQRSAVDLKINGQLEQLAAADGLGFIDRQSLECSAAAQSCTVVGANSGEFYYLDHNRWSYAGRELYGRMLVDKYGAVLMNTRESTAHLPESSPSLAAGSGGEVQ